MKKLFLIFISCIFIFACSSDDNNNNEQIKCWTVLDRDTDEPIEGALVSTFQSPTAVQCHGGTTVNSFRNTNDNGIVCDPKPEYFLCELWVSASGYVPREFTENIPTIIYLTPN